MTMAEDFVFPGAPDPKKDGALEMPPQPGFGKNSGRRIRDKIKEYNDRRGFVPEEQKAVEPTSGSSGSA